MTSYRMFILAGFAVVLTMGFAAVSHAAGPEAFTMELEVPVGEPCGTFSSTGAIDDSGVFCITSGFTTPLAEPDLRQTTHFDMMFLGENGTFFARLDTRLVASDTPLVLADDGRFAINGGTDAYEGITGTGAHTGEIDLTGLATAVWDGVVTP